MRRLQTRLWLLVPVMLLACNLVSSTPAAVSVTPTAIVANSGGSNAAPSVTVFWPPNGSEFVVRNEIPVYVRATDNVGVTRVELRSSSSILSSVPSPERSGEVDFEAILSWTPSRSGQYDVQVIAYRRSIASAPIALTLYVRSRASEVLATPVPLGGQPSANEPVPIPVGGDSVCQVRVDIGNLRYRSGPSTDYEILGLLDLGETLHVTGQNSAGTWWQINRSGQRVWVSSSSRYSTVLSSCAAAPILDAPR